jgi:hypothetical protein
MSAAPNSAFAGQLQTSAALVAKVVMADVVPLQTLRRQKGQVLHSEQLAIMSPGPPPGHVMRCRPKNWMLLVSHILILVRRDFENFSLSIVYK